MISAEGLTVEVGQKTLISDISLEVKPGEVVAMIGANGAGKSTTLKVLCGETIPDAGAVELNGKPLMDWTAVERAQQMAVLPQSSSLSFGLRVQEIVALGRLPTEGLVSKEENQRVILEAMERTDIAHLANRSYMTLSGGEKLRTHLSRTIAQILGASSEYSKVLLLDEPTSSLDLNHQLRVLEIVRELAAEGVGVFAILHDLNLAARFADRIYVLKNGRCLEEGAVSKVLRPEMLLNAFGLKAKLIEVAGLSHPTVCVLERVRDEDFRETEIAT